jgi:hypothetical protein
VLGDSESEEEIHWFEKLQKPYLKSDCLVEKSITSYSSDISNPAAVAGTTGIDTHDCSEKRSAREEKGKTSVLHSSKRKLTSEVSLQCDSAVKRVKQGEMGITLTPWGDRCRVVNLGANDDS